MHRIGPVLECPGGEGIGGSRVVLLCSRLRQTGLFGKVRTRLGKRPQLQPRQIMARPKVNQLARRTAAWFMGKRMLGKIMIPRPTLHHRVRQTCHNNRWSQVSLGPIGVNCAVDIAVDIAVDNFVDRLLGGRHHEEIWPTPADPATSGPHEHWIASAVPFHVKHYQGRSRLSFGTESDFNSWISADISSPT